MSPHVALQVAAPTEELHALVTPVGLLSGVSPHVVLQVRAHSKAFHTLVTPIGLLPRVSPHVGLQVVATAEALLALVTPVRLFGCVGTHVDGLGIIWKTLGKQDTGPALAAAQMPSQLLTVDQPLPALKARGHAVDRR